MAQPVAVQFHCNGSTLSKIDFQLNTNMYKLSLVKKKVVTGKNRVEDFVSNLWSFVVTDCVL